MAVTQGSYVTIPYLKKPLNLNVVAKVTRVEDGGVYGNVIHAPRNSNRSIGEFIHWSQAYVILLSKEQVKSIIERN